jgi:hypothetical protein
VCCVSAGNKNGPLAQLHFPPKLETGRLYLHFTNICISRMDFNDSNDADECARLSRRRCVCSVACLPADGHTDRKDFLSFLEVHTLLAIWPKIEIPPSRLGSFQRARRDASFRRGSENGRVRFIMYHGLLIWLFGFASAFDSVVKILRRGYFFLKTCLKLFT